MAFWLNEVDPRDKRVLVFAAGGGADIVFVRFLFVQWQQAFEHLQHLLLVLRFQKELQVRRLRQSFDSNRPRQTEFRQKFHPKTEFPGS